jgi:hypothetical protein
LIDPNPRRFDLIEFAPAEAIRTNERTAAERTNARLKDEFGGNTIRVTGMVIELGRNEDLRNDADDPVERSRRPA